jgi:Uncharacterized protein conserved in bacteria
MKPFEMTEEFHRTFDARQPGKPTAFTAETASHRANFKAEEIVELLYASSENQTEFEQLVEGLHTAIDKAQAKSLAQGTFSTEPLVDQVDALTDLLYFTYGSFSLIGVDPEPIMHIVHEANMHKLFPDGKPHYDPETNKVLKPENWARDFAPEMKIKKEITRQKRKAE